MQSEVAAVETTLLGGSEAKAAEKLSVSRIEGATSAIIWLSYLGLVSLGVMIMGW